MKRLLLILLLAAPAVAQTPTPLPLAIPGQPITTSPAPAAAATPVSVGGTNGPVSLQLTVDKNRVELAQSVRLTLDLRYPNNLTITPPAADKLEWKPFDVQDARSTRMPAETSANGTTEHLRYSFKIAPFDTGSIKIPNPSISFNLNGKDQNVTVEAPTIEVSRITPGKDDKPDEIRDLKKLDPAPFPPALLAALIVLGLLLLYALYRLIRWARKPKVSKMAPPIAPYPWAQQQLSKLAQDRPDREGRFEEFYERLTMILRIYLGWRFGRSLLEQTTSETLEKLAKPTQKGQLSEEHWRDLRTILEQADLAKFAALPPGEGRADDHLGLALRLIEKNAPFEEPAKTGERAMTSPSHSPSKGER